MITVTITGNLADDPHTFRTSDGRVGCDLRIAVDLPPRGATGDSQVRYVKAVAFGVLASHAAESVRKGDRVTIQGHDLTAEAWVRCPSAQPRGGVRWGGSHIADLLYW
jgi:single-stranded DNA-binding protein